MIKLLAVTNMIPTEVRPHVGTFIGAQVEGLRRAGVEVDVLHLDRLGEGMAVYRKTRRLLRERMARSRPDLVHVMYGGIMAWQVTHAAGDIPTVVTFHNSDLLGENRSGLARRAISHLGVRCSLAAARRASKVVIVSRHLEAALRGQVSPSRVSLIPCGIDLDRFQPLDRQECRRRLGWEPGSFDVLFPANMGDPRKRPELAAAAVDRLRASGVPAVLRVLRGVPYEDVPLWMNASNVHILTSSEEGSPTTVKEALACNLPVVSVDVGDVRDQLAGVEGCHIAAPDPDALAAKLRLVLEHGRLKAGRRRAEDYATEVSTRALLALYGQILEGRR